MPSASPADPGEATPDGFDLANSVADLDRLRVVMIRISRRIRGQAHGGISPSQLAVLGTIITHQPLTNGQIAQIEHVKPSTSSKIVDTLERAGLGMASG